MKFKTKLYINIGSLLVYIIVLIGILMNLLEESTLKLDEVVQDLNKRAQLASEIKYETSRIGTQFTLITTDQSEEVKQVARNTWENSHTNLTSSLEALGKRDTKERTQELIAKYKTLHESFRNVGQQALLAGDKELSPKLRSDTELTRQRMRQIAELLYVLQEQELTKELMRSRDTYNWAVSLIYIYLALGLTIGIGSTIFVISRISKNLNKVTDVMKTATTSDFANLPRIEIAEKGDLGEIATVFNKMADELELQSKLEKQLKEQAEEQSWLNIRITEIATMSHSIESTDSLADMVINKLVPMVRASYGIFYLTETDTNHSYLKRTSGYASIADEKDSVRFRFGQGLVGQCALKKQAILLSDLPNDYVKLGSGIGESSPKNLIILPITFENEVLGVIEIASFETFTPQQVTLLEKVCNNIGTTINLMNNRMKADRLLHESQALTEELQAQSEELQLQQEELRATNEKLEDQYEASEQKNKEIEKVRHALEEKAQQLELSSKYKSEFLANMSHELRTPLNSLLILAQILSENSEGNLTDKQEDYIRTIHASGYDLLNLINDILDLAKVESGKLDVLPKEVVLQDVKNFINNQFTPIATKKNVEFKLELAENLPKTFYTDEQRLQQILKNLLSNAFKFTESGSVTLAVRNVMLNVNGKQTSGEENQLESMLAFSVIDTGIGIDKDKLELIFDAFRQADGTTSRHYGGTGLGLSISREIAYLLGGFIELSSLKGIGSTFTLYLPFQQKNMKRIENSIVEEVAVSVAESYTLPGEKPIKQVGKSILKNKKILIVDDDIRNVYALTIALEKYEMDILVAENGREGIDVLQANPDIDLILMDIMMPEMDGFEAMRRIRQMANFSTLPIIALTAKAMKSSRDECIEAGATDYISKPLDLDQLFSLMQVWLYTKED